MRGSERVDAKENASPLNRKEGQRLDLLHKSFLIPLQLELHIDFAVMDLVLVAEIVFVYQSYRILVLSGKLALSWRFLFLLHEVDAEEDAAVAADQVVEVLSCCNAHVVSILTH